MNPTESLYCFFKWMAEQPRVYEIGGGYHGGALHGALAVFCELNELPHLEDGWESKAKYPHNEPRPVTKRQARQGYVKLD